ncbi:MAG TPA: hypothetical protein VFC73_04060 [Syntrophomonadaceae bacterium]|nr:hypothetical protein [Syntrophomonadaceae bacterium]
MISKNLLQALVGDLERIKEDFSKLAKESEYQEKRNDYIAYGNEMIKIKDLLLEDLDNIESYESYTGTLDRI